MKRYDVSDMYIQNYCIWIVVLETCDPDQVQNPFYFLATYTLKNFLKCFPKSFQHISIFPILCSKIFRQKNDLIPGHRFLHGQVLAGRQHRMAKPGSHGSFWRSPTTLDAGPRGDGMVIFLMLYDVRWWQVACCLQNMHPMILWHLI